MVKMVVIGMVVIGMFLTVQVAWTAGGATVTVSNDGWTVTAEAEQATLSVSRVNLGTVLKEAQVYLRGERGLRRLKGWSVEKRGNSGLSIHTSEPRTAWDLELGSEVLRISTTSADGVLTGEAPAPPDRIVVRLLDPQGVPVTWRGTAEVEMYYGGSKTRNPSFLPRLNPEVMYFALGQVMSSNLHSLFDRKTDTAIEFSEHTVMQRSRHDADLLEVTIPVPGNTQVRVISDYYTKTLGVPYYVPFDDAYFRKPPLVWNNWDNYYADVTEADIVRNTDWIAANLKNYGDIYIKLDDGYDRGNKGEHYWIEKWNQERFPHGLKWLADYIKSKGLHPGIWIVPNASAGAVEQHPDWYLSYKNGKIVQDYNTPALDSSNPQVLNFLKKEFTILDDWGFEYYMFDGEFALPKYAPGVDLDRLYDQSIDPLVAYRNRLKLIRETIGPQRFIEGCPAGTPLNGIGYFNSYFTGEDMYNSWEGQHSLFSSINGNAFLNHIVIYVMPGEGIEVGQPMSVEEAEKKRVRSVVEIARTRVEPLRGFGTTLPEARTLVSYVALTGVIYPVSSVMPELPEERVKLLKMTLPAMPILPIDLFSRGIDQDWDLFKHTTPDDYIHNYPEVLDLKVNAPSGVYDVVGLTNWRSWTTTRELEFADKLGLSPEASYVVFDFWAQKLLGVFKGRMDVTIEPHDTRVLLIHPFMHRPQLVGTSRHITGAYSIKDLAWDGAKNRLHGLSETVPGDDYALVFYVPKGFSVSELRARVPLQHVLTGNALRMTFKGQQAPVEWEVEFRTSAVN